MSTEDRLRFSERVSLKTVQGVGDVIFYRPVWSIHKFNDRKRRYYRAARRGLPMGVLLAQFGHQLSGILRFPGNLALNEGLNELWTLLCGTGATKFDNTNAYIGVGDSATAAAATQTGLQAESNKLYKAMDESYPTYGTSQKATWRSTFDASDANWAWNEITVANGDSDSAKNLNRKTQSMGTKASPAVWTVMLEITGS